MPDDSGLESSPCRCPVVGQDSPSQTETRNWYRIASAPWNDGYYTSADAFYNNGRNVGSLAGTPYVDTSVPARAMPIIGQPKETHDT